MHPYPLLEKFFGLFGEGAQHFASEYNIVLHSWLLMLVLIIVGAIAGKSVRLIPGRLQNFMETVVSGIEEFMVETIGEEGRWLLPLAATIFLYVFLGNLMGLIPGLLPPTSSLNTTLSCALVVVTFTHIIGVKYHGIGYIKHFLGPVWWMSPLIFIIEIIGHLARILSLSIRLFGNMMGHEIVLGILFLLAGAFLAPLPIMAMGIFVAFVQGFVFFLLSIIYFQGAMEHAH
ncbi:MAG: F0F1 ATP synthase subunit A [Desulfatitalea sp.]|nr:F0F1 ATP synthase subunit A [Desulfatitalea sp.]NNK00959.1 F0F1 ATP synthase subunit A [Desulfatitalea sp.]